MSEKPKTILRVVAAEVERDGQFLITQRREQALFPLYWEFPSGKVEPGEGDEVALARELMERLGVEVKVGECTMFVKQEHDDYTLDFHVYQCELPSDQILERSRLEIGNGSTLRGVLSFSTCRRSDNAWLIAQGESEG